MSDAEMGDREVKRQRLGEGQFFNLSHHNPSSTSSNEALTSSSATEHHQQSVINLRNGNVNVALTDIRKALRIDPENVLFNIQAAYAFKAAGRIDKANQAFANARALVTASSEENEEERAALEVCQRYLSPFEHLPTEIIATILEAVNAGLHSKADNPYLVLHISSKLRQLGLSLGTLFKDTARIIASEPRAWKSWGGSSSGTLCLSQLQKDALEFCVQNSRGIVSSLDLEHVCVARMDYLLDVAQASTAALSHLRFPDLQFMTLNDCKVCPGSSENQDYRAAQERRDAAPGPAQARIVGIVAAAHNLSYLYLNLDPLPNEQDLAAVADHSTRPASMVLSFKLYSPQSAAARPNLYQYLYNLMGNLSDLHLKFNDDLRRAGHISIDGWTLATRRADALRELKLELWQEFDLSNVDPAEFPNLETLTMTGEWYSLTGGRFVAKIRAPRLAALAIRANSLHVVDASALTHVYIDLEELTGPSTLTNWFEKAQQLERLELRFVSSSNRDLRRYGTPDSYNDRGDVGIDNDDLVVLTLRGLMPRKGAGSVVCPKLRILGFSCSSDETVDLGWTKSRDWAAYIDREHAAGSMRGRRGEWSVEEDLSDLKVGSGLLMLESQRRRLSQGLEPEKPPVVQQPNASSPFSRGNRRQDSGPTPLTPEEVKATWGHCCALQQILLRGCDVAPEVWKPLIEHSPVEAVCLPDPLQPAAPTPVNPQAQGSRRVHPW